MARHTHLHLAFGISILSLLIDVGNGSRRYGACFADMKKYVLEKDELAFAGSDCFIKYPSCFNASLELFISSCPSCYSNITRFTDIPTNREPVKVSPLKCNEFSNGYERYDTLDILERISLWIVPLLVLIGNFHMAPLGSLNSIYSALHLLGDPIDTICSLLTKLEVSRRLYAKWVSVSAAGESTNEHDDLGIPMSILDGEPALKITPAQARDLATVNSAFDDWLFSTNEIFEAMLNALIRLDDKRRKIFITACIEAAHRLSESRVDERRRTVFAVAGYIVAIIASFLKSIVPNSTRNCTLDTPTCTTLDRKTAYSIAFALSVSWLIPVVLLSSMVGGYTSTRAAARIIRDLKSEVGEFWQIPDLDAWGSTSTLRSPFSRDVVWETCETLVDALPYGGGNYSYRPSKYLPPSNAETKIRYRDVHSFSGDRSATRLYIYSTLPLIIAVGCAMTITWLTPSKGFSCRSLTQLGFLLCWFLSLSLTWLLGNFLTGKYRWYVILIKDLIIASTIIAFIAAAFTGIFNTCLCWSAWNGPFSPEYIEINISAKLEELSKRTWPALMGLCIGGHGLVVLLMRHGNQNGIRLFCRDESERKEYEERLARHVRTITRWKSNSAVSDEVADSQRPEGLRRLSSLPLARTYS